MERRRKIDDRGLYHPNYSTESLAELENSPPHDDEVDQVPPRYGYLQPARPADVLAEDLTTEKIAVKDTGNERVGRGLYARTKIETGQHIFEFDGTRRGEKKGVLTSTDGYSAHAIVVGNSRESSHYFVYATPNKLSPLRYLNHSCDPNAARVPGDPFGFVALRPIAPGEEITADYSLLEANPFWELKECGCGSTNCRHNIGPVDSLPLASLQKYWDRLTPGMQMYAIQFSRDPEIVAVRNKMGADHIFRDTEQPHFLRNRLSYDEILTSTEPVVVKERNHAGAQQLTSRFLEIFAPQETNAENIQTEQQQAA